MKTDMATEKKEAVPKLNPLSKKSEEKENLLDGGVDPSVLVIIQLGGTRPGDHNTARLTELFSDPYFVVQHLKTDVTTTTPGTEPKLAQEKQILSAENLTENVSLLSMLDYSRTGPKGQGWYNDLPCIIIKDTSVSHVDSSASMRNRIETALTKAPKAGVFFLCRWDDDCDKMQTIDATHPNLKWTIAPHGVQAVMYRPATRDLLLSKDHGVDPTKEVFSSYLTRQVNERKIMAATFTPNLVHFDPTLATSAKDFARLNECATPQTTTTTTNWTVIFWAVIIAILVFAVAWFLLSRR